MFEYVYIFILGLFIGSFLNVLADRLSKEESINGRSRCDYCKHKLVWYDLVPIISFTLLRGKCRYCRASIAGGHLYAEIMTGVLFLLTWYLSNIYYGNIYFNTINIVITAILIVMLLSDIRYQIIPDEMQIGLIVMGVIRFALTTIDFNQPILSQIIEYEYLILVTQFIGRGIIVGLPLLIIFLITKGKGMGFGDVKLTFAMGLVLGIWNGLYALYIGFITGGIAGAFILLTKKAKLKSKIAFGPFLILGFYIMIFWWYEVGQFIQKVYDF